MKIEKICKKCGAAFDYTTSNFCSMRCRTRYFQAMKVFDEKT